jgi:hypothetical protein
MLVLNMDEIFLNARLSTLISSKLILINYLLAKSKLSKFNLLKILLTMDIKMSENNIENPK